MANHPVLARADIESIREAIGESYRKKVRAERALRDFVAAHFEEGPRTSYLRRSLVQKAIIREAGVVYSPSAVTKLNVVLRSMFPGLRLVRVQGWDYYAGIQLKRSAP